VLAALDQRYQAAQLALNQQLANGIQRVSTHSHGAGANHIHSIRQSSTLEVLLPPRYQGAVQVSAAPMRAADLVYDAAGNVAWDEIWGDFCDLALAGGPAHRGTLLEPVDPQEVAADPTGYQRVLAELERGIHLITGLSVIAHQYPGWIGLQCTDAAMALWLLRAIVVENVSVRREDQVLYFPVGPNFRLAYEIKNIITVIAKTHHYWTEHLQSQLTPS
jgi:sirohydrochlorin cobaltochelatase